MANQFKRARDARTGRFIPVKAAARRPSTTVVETVKRAPAKRYQALPGRVASNHSADNSTSQMHNWDKDADDPCCTLSPVSPGTLRSVWPRVGVYAELRGGHSGKF